MTTNDAFLLAWVGAFWIWWLSIFQVLINRRVKMFLWRLTQVALVIIIACVLWNKADKLSNALTEVSASVNTLEHQIVALKEKLPH